MTQAAEPQESRDLDANTIDYHCLLIPPPSPQAWEQLQYFMDIVKRGKSHWLIATCHPTEYFSKISPLDLRDLPENADLRQIVSILVAGVGEKEYGDVIRRSIGDKSVLAAVEWLVLGRDISVCFGRLEPRIPLIDKVISPSFPASRIYSS